MIPRKNFEFKENNKLRDLVYCHPALLIIFAHTVMFCHKHDIDLVITSFISTLEEDERLGRVTAPHRTGRAIDISFRSEHGWTDKLIEKFEREINTKFKGYGAVVIDIKAKQIPRPIVVHDAGTGKHAHIQVKP